MKAQFSAEIKMLIIGLLITVHFCRLRKAEKCLFELNRIWRCIGQKAPLYVRLLREMIIFRDLDYPSLGSFRTVSSHSFILSRCEAETVGHIEILNQRHEFAASQRKSRTKTNFLVFSHFSNYEDQKNLSVLETLKFQICI